MNSPAPNKIVFGNAQVEGRDRGGWFVGHFIDSADLRSTEDLEVKWGTHASGDQRSEWSVNQTATTLSVLIQGRFRLRFPDRECVLTEVGDYVIWAPGVPHTWLAEQASTILTVRYPSHEGDSIGKGG
jgi:hypothetical protein